MNLRNTDERVTKDAKWLIGIVLAVATPLVGFQWKQSVEVSMAMESLVQLRTSIDKLGENMTSLMVGDLSDIKTRLAVVEQKGIPPQTSVALKELEGRIRMLENARHTN